MKKMVASILGILFAILIAPVTTLPFSIAVLLMLYIWYKDSFVFAVAFILGVFLDAMLVRDIGKTSLFFVVLLLVVFLYERRFEIDSIYFVFLSSILASLAYLWIFGYTQIFQQAAIISTINVILFGVLRFILRREPQLSAV